MLSDYLQILNRRKWIIIITAITTFSVFIYGRQLIPSSHKVSVVLRIVPYAPGDPPFTQLVYAERIMNTYVRISTSKPLLAEMRQRLDLDPERPTNVEASIIPDSELLQITVEDQDPITARDAANTIAELLLSEQVIRDIQIYLIEPATLPDPVSPLLNIIYGAIALTIGLAGGIGLAFLIENLDTRLNTTGQIEAVTGLPLLAKIPKIRQRRKSLYLLSDPQFNHRIRSLRTILLHRDSVQPIKTILLTSALPKEGKSTIISNLAISLAMAERKVLLIDADLYLPTIHEIFNLDNAIGLSEYLENPNDLIKPVQETDVPGLSIIPGGPKTPKSTELLGSENMRTLISQLIGNYDHILIDTPAFLGLPDASTIAPIVDAVILVTKRGMIKKPALLATLQQLGQLGVQPSGVVVNYVEKGPESRYSGYYHLIKNYDPISDNWGDEQDFNENQKLNQAEKLDHSFGQDDFGQLETKIAEENNKKIESLSKDDLTDIRGIGPKTKNALNSTGIYTFAQLADLDSDDLAKRIDGRITIDRTQMDQWINQARALCETIEYTQISDHPENPIGGPLE